MKQTMLAALALALVASVAQAQDNKLTKEDVAKLARAGVSDDLIIAVIDQAKTSLALSADDILALKKDGVSDKVLAAMVGKGARPEAAPPKAGGDTNLTVKNTSHRGIKVVVDEREQVVNFTQATGTDLDRGTSLAFSVKAGEYKVAIEGSLSRHRIQLPGTLLVRGTETEYLDVMTLTMEDGRGSEVMIMHSQGKQMAGQRRPAEPVRLYGQQLSYLPYVSRTVFVGAGCGTVITHRHRHTTWRAGIVIDVWWHRRW